MSKSPRRRIDFPPTNNEPNLDNQPHLLPGLTQLAELLLIARARGEDTSERALSVSDLASFGLTLADCRSLLSRGLVEMASSPSAPASGYPGRGEGGLKANSRSHHANASATKLGPRTRLILTDAGLAFITKQPRLLEPSPPAPASGYPGQGEGGLVTPPPLVPHYDIDTRELSVAGVVILRLPVQARNLAAVLTALEHSGWKPRVARALHSRPHNNRHNLGVAAYSLNQRQTLIDFHADGGGMRWNWRADSPSAPTAGHQRRPGKRSSKRAHPPRG
jgi:hypothetical protein